MLLQAKVGSARSKLRGIIGTRLFIMPDILLVT